jgi:uncharacterized integral membrane protein
MPLLRSLADPATGPATNMALLTELFAPPLPHAVWAAAPLCSTTIHIYLRSLRKLPLPMHLPHAIHHSLPVICHLPFAIFACGPAVLAPFVIRGRHIRPPHP